MSSAKPQPIAFIPDAKLSRERLQLLSRTLSALRHHREIVQLPVGITEEEALLQLRSRPFSLILAPWHQYLSWNRVEAFFGLTRTSGPTFAGYFAERLLPYELGLQSQHQRNILFDFTHLHPREISLLIRSLLTDTHRSGLKPLIDPQTRIYCELWGIGQGQGHRIDTLFSLPELTALEWLNRGNAIRTCLSALWSLVYEAGPGKSDFANGATSRQAKAWFQVAADRNGLFMRLVCPRPGWTPKDTLNYFWPDKDRATDPSQLLMRFADFLRVHTITETQDIEVTLGFFPSAPAEKAHAELHTLWVEPLSPQTVLEVPYIQAPIDLYDYEAFSAKKGAEPPEELTPATPASSLEEALRAKERHFQNAMKKIQSLQQELHEKTQLIEELRSGGIGMAQPPAVPEIEILLESFQQRFAEAQLQIRKLELEIARAHSRNTTPQEIADLRQRIAALANREKEWIRRIGEILEQNRKKGA